jgi:hypothetical protein
MFHRYRAVIERMRSSLSPVQAIARKAELVQRVNFNPIRQGRGRIRLRKTCNREVVEKTVPRKKNCSQEAAKTPLPNCSLVQVRRLSSRRTSCSQVAAQRRTWRRRSWSLEVGGRKVASTGRFPVALEVTYCTYSSPVCEPYIHQIAVE